MHTFMQKPKATAQINAPKSRKPNQANSRADRGENAKPPAFGNQAALQVLQRELEGIHESHWASNPAQASQSAQTAPGQSQSPPPSAAQTATAPTTPTTVPFVVHTTPRMNAHSTMNLSLSQRLRADLGQFHMEASVLVHPDPSWPPLGGTYRDWRLGYLQTVTDVEDTRYYIVDPRQRSPELRTPSPLPQGPIFVDRLGPVPPAIWDAPALQDPHLRPFYGPIGYPGRFTFGGTYGYIFDLINSHI